MTETADAPAPVLEFTTSSAARARPTISFNLDDRPVVATAPKAAHWARMWAAGASGDARILCYQWLNFLDVALGEETAKWLKSREDDPDDAYDIPDLVSLVKFLNIHFEPLLRPEFEAAGVAWQNADVASTPSNANRAARRAVTAKPKAKAKKAITARPR